MKRNVVKSSASKEQIKVNKEFTDRTFGRDKFWELYRQLETDVKADGFYENEDINPCVLSFYGIGGMGKSRLTEKIISELEETYTKETPPRVYMDLKNYDDKKAILEALMKKLSESNGFSFPLFEISLFFYAKSLGQSVDDIRKLQVYTEHPVVKTLIDAGGLFFNPISSIASLTTDVLNLLGTKTADKILIKKYEKILGDNAELLSDMIRMDTKEILQNLHSYFALDLLEELKNQKNPTPVPALIVLDTYEDYVNVIEEDDLALSKDEWVRELICTVPGVFWLIMGREELHWGRQDEEWKEVVHSYQLEKFEEKDTFSYLEKAGITDSKIKKHISRLSSGTPIYLNMCVDCYSSALNDGKTITVDIFGKNEKDLIRRYANYVPSTCKDVFYLITCLGYFNDDIIRDLSVKLYGSFQRTSYETIKELSVISYDEISNRYSINDMISNVLWPTWKENLRNEALEVAQEYILDKIKETNHLSSDYGMYIMILARTGLIRCYGDEEALYNFFEDSITEPLDILIKTFKVELVDEILTHFFKTDLHEGSLFDIRLKTYMLSTLIMRGQYAEATKTADEIVAQINALDEYDHVGIIKSLRVICDVYARNGEYQKNLEVAQKAYDICLALNQFNVELFCKMTYSYGDALFYTGKYKKAEEILKFGLEKSTNVLSDSHADTLWIMNVLAILYADRGNFKDALELQEHILKVRKEKLGDDKPDTLWAMHNVANSLEDIGKLNESLEYRDTILRLRLKTQGENHQDTWWAYHARAKSIAKLGDFETAQTEFMKVYDWRVQTLGKNSPDTCWIMHTLVKFYLRENKPQKAEPFVDELVTIRSEILGNLHPVTIKTLFLQAECKESLKNYKMALQIYERLVQGCEPLYGSDHSIVMDAKEGAERCKKMLDPK